MTFANVIGQETIARELRLQVKEGRVPHAQMFCGPEGSGKMAMALAYAGYLLCEHPTESECCGTCSSCRMMRVLGHPDLHFVFPVINVKKAGSSSSLDYMEPWRSMITRSPYFNLEMWIDQMDQGQKMPGIFAVESDRLLAEMSLMSSRGGRKVVIMWLPERMNLETANKMLKLLEEPPAGSVFILVSDDPDLVLPTIVSRTQRINFMPAPEAAIRTALMERHHLTAADAEQIAHYAQGNYIKALQSVQVNLNAEAFFNAFVSLMRLSYMRKVKDLRAWSEEIATWNREKQLDFLAYCQRLVRENFIYNFKRPELNFMSLEENRFSANFARFINERNVVEISAELERAQRDVRNNVNARMVFFDFALKIIVLILK